MTVLPPSSIMLDAHATLRRQQRRVEVPHDHTAERLNEVRRVAVIANRLTVLFIDVLPSAGAREREHHDCAHAKRVGIDLQRRLSGGGLHQRGVSDRLVND